jgi:hypothetical protein
VDEDYVEIELRPAQEVSERCILIAALIRRLWIESSFASREPGDWSAEAFDLREWLRDEGAWKSLTSSERDFLQREVGDATQDQIAGVAWQAEGLTTLGWALDLVELPPPGKLGDITTVVQAVPAPWDKIGEWTRAARLRPEMEIATERDRAEILEWRIGIERPRRQSDGQARADYMAAIAEVVLEARASGLLESVVDADFAIGGRPVASFDDPELERLSALAEERLRALNWLCGHGITWDAAPLDI